MKKFPPLIAIFILAYAGWNAADLIPNWIHSPFDRYSWVAFLVWISPLFALYASPSPYFLAAAVILSLLGTLGSLNALQHIALACGIASLIPLSGAAVLWLAGSVSWMPLFGYLLKTLPVPAVWALRIGVAVLSTLWLFKRKRVTEG